MRSLVGIAAIGAGLCVVSLAATAQSPGADGLRDIASCRQIPKAGDRLRCFDRTTEFLEEASAPLAAVDAENAGEPEQSTGADIAEASPTAGSYDNDGVDPVAGFGAEDLAPDEDTVQLKELRVVATSISQNARGKYIFELENGQVWRQIQADTNTLRVRRKNAQSGHDVIIRKRALGAYSLRLTTAKRSVLVRRVR